MAETEEKRQNEQTIIDNEKDKSTLVIDEEDNGFICDIYDIIETSQERTAIKVRNLIANGLELGYIVETYSRIAGNINNIEDALNALEEAFNSLAKIINDLPNGIVIDLETGKIDVEKSEEQSKRVGIHDDGEDKTQDEIVSEKIKEALSSEKSPIANFVNPKSLEDDIRKTIDSARGLDSLLANNGNSVKKMSTYFQEHMKNSARRIKGYTEEQAQYIRLEHEIEHAKGTPLYSQLLSQRNTMLEKNPTLAALKTRDEENNILPMVENFMDSERDYALGLILSKFKGMPLDRCENKMLRKFMTISALAATNVKAFSEEAWSILGLKNIELNARLEYLNGILGTEMRTQEDLNAKINLFSEALEHAMNIPAMFESMQNEKITDKEIEDLIRSMGGEKLTITAIKHQLTENKLSTYQKHFRNSELNFSKQDEEKLNELYRDTTIATWLDSRDEVEMLDFAMHYLRLEELEGLGDNSESNRNKINAEKKRIIKKINDNPKLEKYLSDDDKLLPEVYKRAREYEEAKRKSVLIHHYTRDLKNGEIFTRESFDELSVVGKASYFRMALVGLDYAEKNNDSIIKKLALRRLEVLNTSDETYITINKDGSYVINEELLLKEMNKTNNSVNYGTIEEMKKLYISQYKTMHVIKKLEEYMDSDDKTYVKLEGTPAEKLEQIEGIKSRANLEKARKKEEDTRKREEYKSRMKDAKNNSKGEDSENQVIEDVVETASDDQLKQSEKEQQAPQAAEKPKQPENEQQVPQAAEKPKQPENEQQAPQAAEKPKQPENEQQAPQAAEKPKQPENEQQAPQIQEAKKQKNLMLPVKNIGWWNKFKAYIRGLFDSNYSLVKEIQEKNRIKKDIEGEKSVDTKKQDPEASKDDKSSRSDTHSKEVAVNVQNVNKSVDDKKPGFLARLFGKRKENNNGIHENIPDESGGDTSKKTLPNTMDEYVVKPEDLTPISRSEDGTQNLSEQDRTKNNSEQDMEI